MTETCECETDEEVLQCPAQDQVCEEIVIDDVAVEECYCLECEDTDRICTLEEIDGIEQEICRCPELTESECSSVEEICFVNEGEEDEICLCPDDGCEDEQKICSTKTDKNGLDV